MRPKLRKRTRVPRRGRNKVKSIVVTNLLIHAVAKVVVPLFFLGMVGSMGVIAISFVEDLRELFGDEE